MKKFLYCAAVVALAAACTQEDDLLNNAPSSQAQGQGLSFNVTLADNNIETKGELYEDEGTYPFFWYAEQDRINVFGVNLKGAISSGSAGTNTAVVGYGNNTSGNGVATHASGIWSLPSSPASYKATQSKGEGKFTAANDGDMLVFDGEKTSTIVATYGNIAASAVESKMNDDNTDIIPGLEGITKLELTTDATNGSNIEQTVKHPNEVVAPMYSVSSAAAEEAYNSVGEQANLQLIRPFPVIRFTTTGVDKYAKDFGPLESVSLITRRKDASGKWQDPGSTIAYKAGAVYTVVGDEEGFASGWEFANNGTEFRHKVTVNLTSTEDWSDDDAVYMTVAPVDRSELEDGDMLVITYQFKNIIFTLDGSKENAKEFETLITKNSWSATTADGRPNAVTPLPALDINNYDYLLVGQSGNYTLIINRGSIASTINGTNVIWPVGGTTGKPISDVKKVIVNCDLEDADFANLNKFTAAEHIELTEETNIPTDGLKALTGSGSALEELVLPKVTTIAEDFVDANFETLTKLELGSYPFETMAINNRFFNAQTADKLTYIDAAAVDDFGPIYMGRQAIIFQNYNLLDSIKVGNGAELYAHQFDGCVKLQKVIGSVDLSSNDATHAFKGVKALKEVNVTTDIIPDYAFYQASAIESVLKDGNQLAPTAVGEFAFMEAVDLKYMDLANTTELGERAFNRSGLIASKKDADLKVGAKVISEAALANTKVTFVHFTNAESVENQILSGVNTLVQIKFNKIFEASLPAGTKMDTQSFGATTNSKNVDLLVADGQEYNGATINVGGTDFTFKSIRVEAAY